MVKTLNALHDKKDALKQSELSRIIYAVPVSDVLNGSVYASSSRLNKELLNEGLIKEVKKNHYVITSKGVALLLFKQTPQKLVPMWTSKNKGTRKKNLNS